MVGPALNEVISADQRLEREVGVRLTLDPSRERATSLEALHRSLVPRLADPGMEDALARGLVETASAIRRHFPDNLLWDFDALAAALVARCPDSASLLRAFEDVVALNALFGCETTIRFRYVHDFIYGFDWAKWVRRDPGARTGVGPFDAVFLTALLARGRELLELIAADDEKYPRLPDERARNPFVFSREPEDELRLHRALAAEGLVPVPAWRLDGTPTWDRPFADLRTARAASA